MNLTFLRVAGLLWIGLWSVVFADETKPTEEPTPPASSTASAPATTPASTDSTPVAPAAKPAAPATPTSATSSATAVPIARVITQAELISQQLQGVEDGLSDDEVVDVIDRKFDRFNRAIQAFYKESSKLLVSTPSLDRIRWLESAWTYISSRLKDNKDDLSGREEEIEKTLAQLDQMTDVWKVTLENATTTADTPPEVTERARGVLAEIAATRKSVTQHQDHVVALLNRITDLDTRVTNMLAATERGRKRAIDQLLDRNITPIWSIGEGTPRGKNWVTRGDLSWTSQSASLRSYVIWQQVRFLVHAAAVVVLLVLMYGLRRFVRRWAKDDAQLAKTASIFERPVSIAFLLALMASDWIYPMEPRLLTAWVGAFILVPTVVILRRLIVPRLFVILNALVVFYFVDQLRLLLVSLPVIARLTFLAETLAGSVFLVYVLRSFHREGVAADQDHLGKIVRIGAQGSLILLSIAFIGNLLGYGHLSYLLRNGVMRSAYAAVMLYAAFEILGTFVLIALHIPPMPKLGLVKRHGPMLIARLNTFFRWTIILVWVAFALDMFSLWTPLVNNLSAFFSAKHEIGTHDFTLNNILLLVVTLCAGFLISRFLRFVLDADIYPRLSLPHGVPYAISTVLHYLILVAAFLGAAAALGFDMTNLTILVSALGVGIGFGLQNIINNFVSGLILLFERPVKIGDSIQVGDAVGTVRRIGIRASILLTPGGSEIIVPNGTLISDRVTNWTLSSRRRIIVIPINITRGGDPRHIMDILRREALQHPEVAKQPAPEVLMTNLGPTFGFEVQAWTEKVEEWNRVRSDLSLAINTALAKENISVA